MRKDYYVYTYSYPGGLPFYVGKGCGRRIRVHLCDAKANRNTGKWAVRVISKLLNGGQEPEIKKLADGLDNELACLAEQELISKYGRRDMGTGILVNCTKGGDGSLEISPEIKARKIKGLVSGGQHTRFQKGLTPWNKGQKMSEECVEKIRRARTGVIQPETQKQKRADALRGYKHKILTCPNCGKSGGGTSLKRWHFDNCTGTHEFRARATVNGKRIHLGRFTTKEDAANAVAVFYNSIGGQLCHSGGKK